MRDDLIARLLAPWPMASSSRAWDDYTEVEAQRAEAASALAEQQAEIAKWQSIGAALGHDLADVLESLECCDSEVAVQKVATLRARLAKAEAVVEAAATYRARQVGRLLTKDRTEERREVNRRVIDAARALDAALAALNATKETNDA